MDIICRRCGEEKPSNKFYYHKGDKKFMHPCKVCYSAQQKEKKEKETPEARQKRREMARLRQIGKPNGCSIKQLEKYVIALNELGDWGRELFFKRGSGFVPDDKKREEVSVVTRRLTRNDQLYTEGIQEIGYRFMWNEQQDQWETGYFNTFGKWVMVSCHGMDVQAARSEAMRLACENIEVTEK